MFDLDFYPHPLLLLPFFFFVALPAAADSYNSTYPSCPAYNCGNVTISYPFWKTESEPTHQFCGYQGFGINCIWYSDFYDSYGGGYHSKITFGGHFYDVREINYETKIISVSYTYADHYGPACPWTGHGINLETLPLKFLTPVVNLSFHYNCNGCPSFATEISCREEDIGRKSCVHIMNTGTVETDWDDYSCRNEAVAVTDRFNRTSNLSLEVYHWYDELVLQWNDGLELQWRTMDGCNKCEESDGRCGHHNTTGFICFCTDGTISKDHCKQGILGDPSFSLTTKLVGSALLSFLIIFTLYCVLKPILSNFVASLKHKTEEDRNIEDFVMQYGSLSTKRYSYNEIKKMTNSFKIKLGEGGFGQVFKGKLSDGRIVAVKVLNSSKANGQEFINEVSSIGRTSHVNIVTLLGFCFHYKKRALVYEYMPNGSLEKFIHNLVPADSSENIGTKTLYEIAHGIACGLDYLHRGCNTRILHLDIKPHNILLDEDFCPKIADFGLAKLHSRKESVVSMLEARGTLGYIAPEVYNRNFGRVSHKSDVYSFGMLLLEMVGKRKNIDVDVGSGRTSEIYFPYWIYKRLHKLDFLLDSITTTEENEYARKMAIVGLHCIQPDPNLRPSINEVKEMLEGSMETLKFPPKPIFASNP